MKAFKLVYVLICLDITFFYWYQGFQMVNDFDSWITESQILLQHKQIIS